MSDYQELIVDLPSDWSVLPVGDIGEVISGGTPSRDNPRYWNGSIPWVTPGEVTGYRSKHLQETAEKITAEGLSQSGATLLPVNSLLITTRASLGAAVLNTVPATTNQGFKSVVFKKTFNPNYYYHWTRILSPELERRASGTTFLEISGSQFRNIEVPVPPYSEQTTIAQLLDTLDTQIQKTEALIAKLEKVKEGLLHDLLTRGIDKNGQLRPSPEQVPELYKESPLGMIPREWSCKTLAETLSLQRGFDITVAEQTPGAYPVVSSSGISSYHIDFKVRGPGVVTGRKGKLGEVYFISSNFWPHDTSLWVTNFHGNDVRFSALLLGRLNLERFDAATSVPTLNRNFVAHLPVAFPPKIEQQRVVKKLEVIDRRISQEAHLLKSNRKFKIGLMDDLLTGRVRVTPLLEKEQ